MILSLDERRRFLDKIVVRGPGSQKYLMVECRRFGLTLRDAAERAGLHVATVCRWQADDPAFASQMREAAREARIEALEAKLAAQ